MNKQELRQKLNQSHVSEKLYSLEGELLPDRIVLYQSYNDWMVFYFDERGNKRDEKVFSSETEACEYMFESLIKHTHLPPHSVSEE